MKSWLLSSALLCRALASPALVMAQTTSSEITFATYNVSMEAENYFPRGTPGNSEKVLIKELASGTNQQIKNIAQIIKTVRPDVILLNEFDYVKNPAEGVGQFIKGYLKEDSNGTKGIDYPYYYYSTVNTGQPTPYDLDRNGKTEQYGSDA